MDFLPHLSQFPDRARRFCFEKQVFIATTDSSLTSSLNLTDLILKRYNSEIGKFRKFVFRFNAWFVTRLLKSAIVKIKRFNIFLSMREIVQS